MNENANHSVNESTNHSVNENTNHSVNENTIHAEESSAERTCYGQHSSHGLRFCEAES